MRAAWWGVALLALLLWGVEAEAKVRRYALVVGANRGSAQEGALRYAERDAARFAEVVRALGGVSPEDLVLLTNTDAGSVARVLEELHGRIARHREAAPEDETVLLLFYSGHADAGGLNMNQTQLGFGALKEALRGSPAQLRVLIVDACRSGEITRVKGAKPAEPFLIEPGGAGQGEGFAIITSAASDEDAQESDRLEASFFTHHLLSGLLGAADSSGDEQVTLGEAYKYAYEETLRSTSGARAVQHPTYWFEIKGREEVVLTSLREPSRSRGRLRLLDGGSYVIFRDGGGLAAELSAAPEVSLSLEEGVYLIRRRGEASVQEVRTRLEAGQEVTLAAEDMEEVPYGQVVRKGLGGQEEGLALGLVSGVGLSGALVEGTGPLLLGQVGAQVELEPLSVQVRLRYGQAERRNDFLEIEQGVLGVDVAALKLLDLSWWTVGFGVRAGADWVYQRFETAGQAPDRDTLTLRAAPLLSLGASLWPQVQVTLEGSGDAYLFTVQSAEGEASTELRFVPQVMAGVLVYLQ